MLVGLGLSIPGVPGPGILVLLVGVFVLLPESPRLRKQYAKLKRRYPKIIGPIDRRIRRSKDPAA
jgi:hypothetical protein